MWFKGKGIWNQPESLLSMITCLNKPKLSISVVLRNKGHQQAFSQRNTHSSKEIIFQFLHFVSPISISELLQDKGDEFVFLLT